MKEFLTPQIQKFLAYGGQSLTLYLLAGVVLLFVLFVFYFFSRTSLMRFTMRRARKKFSEELMQKNRLLRQYWERYANTFILDLEQNKRTTNDARDFFNSRRLMSEHVNERWWLFSSSLVFLIGFCAIIAQMVLGLAMFDITSSDTIMTSIKQCLVYLANGMVVFIVAMVLSVVQFFVAKSLIARTRDRVEKLADMLNSRFKMSAMDERAVTLAEYSAIFREIMEELFMAKMGSMTLTPGGVSCALLEGVAQQGKALAHMAKNSAAGSNGAAAESVQRASEKTGRAVAESLRPVLEQIATSLAALEKKERGEDSKQ